MNFLALRVFVCVCGVSHQLYLVAVCSSLQMSIRIIIIIAFLGAGGSFSTPVSAGKFHTSTNFICIGSPSVYLFTESQQNAFVASLYLFNKPDPLKVNINLPIVYSYQTYENSLCSSKMFCVVTIFCCVLLQ